EAFPLKCLVADGEDLVEEQDVRVEVRGDGETESHVHPRRIRPDGHVEELAELGEGNDLVEALVDVTSRQPVDRAVHVDVLAPGEVGVEARAEPEQRTDVASHLEPARVWLEVGGDIGRSEEHTSELQSLAYLVCRLLLEKKKKKMIYTITSSLSTCD